MSEDTTLVQAVLSWGCARAVSEFVAAGPDSDQRWLEIADVIAGGGVTGCGPGGSGGTVWLRAALARYPGCAVVAAGHAGGCVVVARDKAAGRSGICGHYCCGALAGGALVHCWLTERWPVSALMQATLTPMAATRGTHCGWQADGQAAGWPLSLMMSVRPAASALSAFSWLRTGSASGAPSSW